MPRIMKGMDKEKMVLSARNIASNNVELTKYMSKRKKYDLFWRDLMRPVKRKNI